MSYRRRKLSGSGTDLLAIEAEDKRRRIIHNGILTQRHYLKLYTNLKANFSPHFDEEKFRKAARLIAEEFGLSLFGFDVIIPIAYNNNDRVDYESELVVIDVNFFPSYKEIPDFPHRLRSFLRQSALFPKY
jgi:hypothetical protein